jgi:hypothetical protein
MKCRHCAASPIKKRRAVRSRPTRSPTTGLRSQVSVSLSTPPGCEYQDVTDNTNHVCAAMVNGKLRIDANENQETVVHIAVPVETIRDVVNPLEEVSPGI